MNTIKIDSKNTKIIAHMGLSGLEIENSIPAFVAAGNRSYFGIETDVHRTADEGKFVLIHDKTTDRMAGDSINVETSSYELVRKIILGNDKRRQELVIPSLEDYIRVCKKYEKMCILELKCEFTPDEIDGLINAIDKMGYLEHVVFISFGLDLLKEVRMRLPSQEIQYLRDEYEEELLGVLKEYHFDLSVEYKSLTKEIIDLLHSEGIKVACYTCDNNSDAEILIDWGVDYLTTNILE